MISATTPTDATTAAPGVSLHGLAKSFRGPRGPVHAVRGVDLTIAPGETVALLGPNGAGKTTTVDMMLGLLPPDAGAVSLFGLSPRRAVDAGLVGAMLQTGALLRDLTVRELVSMMAGLHPRPRDVDEVVALAGIADIASRRTHRLSGGESQRVRFALALVSDPRLLVLDEPTVAMDVEARHAFWSIMGGIARAGTTVVFATHYLEEADAFADRVVLMARGAVVADGTAAEIKTRVGLRVIRATVPGADLDALGALPGVEGAERRGERVTLTCADSDAAIRALLRAEPGARDVEISGAGLEEAFLRLTGDEEGS